MNQLNQQQQSLVNALIEKLLAGKIEGQQSISVSSTDESVGYSIVIRETKPTGKYRCELCDVSCARKDILTRHNKSKLHQKMLSRGKEEKEEVEESQASFGDLPSSDELLEELGLSNNEPPVKPLPKPPVKKFFGMDLNE